MAFPMGCSEWLSQDAARDNNLFSSILNNIISLTSSIPFVKVPVLSKATTDTVPIFSKASPDFITTPNLVACPIAATIETGVASANAQGQKPLIPLLPW